MKFDKRIGGDIINLSLIFINISFMSKIKQKIIELLAYHPEREFYAQEVATKINCSKASAVIILKSLLDKKIVHREKRGHMKFYQINPENIEVKRIKTDFALKKLNPLLSKLKKVSQKIILFGSASRGEQTFDSDIDLLILTNDKRSVKKVLGSAKEKLKIKPIVKTPSEWSEEEVKNPAFYGEIKSGVVLHNYVSRV